MTEADGTLASRPQRFDDLRQQLGRRSQGRAVLSENEEGAVGLPEQMEKIVHYLRQQRFEIEGLAEGRGDIQQTAQLVGRLAVQQQVAAAADDGLDGGEGLFTVMVLGRVLFRRRRVNEDDDIIANPNFVIMLQERLGVDSQFIDEGVIAARLAMAVSIFDVIATLKVLNGRVFPANGILALGETDPTIRLASEDEACAVERDSLADFRPLTNEQRGHS